MISFIVPAHNEERLLGATLDAIARSARGLDLPFEVIVVNDGSTDQTATIAAQHGARVLDVNVRHIAAARNIGAQAASGELLVFVDADTLVNARVVAAAVRTVGDGAVGGGATVCWDGVLPVWARVLAKATLWSMRVGNLAAGCFLFSARPAFDSVGGFDESVYAGEEIWLSRALKRRGQFVILRESVTTSGRKLRTYSGFEVLRMTVPLLVRGFGVFRDRRDLELWYGERRPDRSNGRQ